MRRSPCTRILSALFAVWLALVMGEAGLVHHHCPMHDAAGAAHAGSMSAHAGHGDGAPHGAHHSCTCIGACSASSAVMLTPAPDLPAPAFVRVAVGAPDAARDTAPSARAHFTLPFANGPPAIA